MKKTSINKIDFNNEEKTIDFHIFARMMSIGQEFALNSQKQFKDSNSMDIEQPPTNGLLGFELFNKPTHKEKLNYGRQTQKV